MSKGLLLDQTSANNITTPVPPGKVWIFADRTTDQYGNPQLRGKLSDGSFITLGSTTTTTTIIQKTKFYQCTSIDTDSEWTGKEWVLTGGIYVLSDEESTGLVIAGFKPVVGYSYSADTLIMAGKLYAGPDPMPTDGLVFHASLASNAPLAETGQALTEVFGDSTEGISYTTLEGVSCAYFNGNSYLTFPDTGFPEGETERTFSMWINCPMDNNDTYVPFVYGKPENNAFSGFIINAWIKCGGYFKYEGASSTCISENALQANFWHHIVITYNGSVAKGYVDGVYSKEASEVWCSTILEQGVIGRNLLFGKDRPYIGYLAGLRVYNKVLSVEDIGLLASEFTPTA